MVLDAADFKALTGSAIQLFDLRVSSLDTGRLQDLSIEAARLESQVAQLYGMAALCSRQELDLDRVAELWDAVVKSCDAIAQSLHLRCGANPSCAVSYDKILDIRNEAAQLRDLHAR